MRKERTKAYRINFMDILVIFLVLACLINVFVRAWTTQQLRQEKDYNVYFQIEDIKASSYSFFDGHAGEAVRSNGKILGTLGADFSRDVAIYTYTENMEGKEGEVAHAYYPAFGDGGVASEEKCSIRGNIVVNGAMSGHGIFLDDDAYLTVGQTINIETEYIKATIKITDISEK